MRGVVAWLWGRYRRTYVPVALAVISLVTIVAVTTPSILVMVIYVEASLGEALHMVAVGLAIDAVGGLVVYLSMRPSLRPLARWARDPSTADPQAAWETALGAPRRAGVRWLLVLLVPHRLFIAYALAPFDTRPSDVVLLGIAQLLAEGTAALLIGIGSRALFAPAVGAASDLLPPGTSPPAPDWTLRRRLVLGVWLMSAVNALCGGLFAWGADSRSSSLAISLLTAFGFGTYTTALLDGGLIRPSLQPVGDLIAATRRVRMGDLTGQVTLASADEVGELVTSFNEMQRGLAERETLHTAFGSYVDPLLAQRLVESGSSTFAGEDLVLTVMFADVRDFTAMAEQLEPAEAVERLNQLFDVVVPVVHEHGGHANHYLGDGLLAIFGAPQPLERHADHAVGAALEIQRRVQEELGPDLRLGIGINTGRVIAGTVGGGGRLEFTVIGDTVNVAARVEHLTRSTDDLVLITDATRSALSTPRPRTIPRGAHDLRGKSAAVTVHAVRVPCSTPDGSTRGEISRGR